jgi:hypothetical protein
MHLGERYILRHNISRCSFLAVFIPLMQISVLNWTIVTTVEDAWQPPEVPAKTREFRIPDLAQLSLPHLETRGKYDTMNCHYTKVQCIHEFASTSTSKQQRGLPIDSQTIPARLQAIRCLEMHLR